MMTIIQRQSMTVFMLAVFTTMVVIAFSYPEGARFMPLTVGIPGILLCCLQIALDFRKQMVLRKRKTRSARLSSKQPNLSAIMSNSAMRQ